jgi:hypothetical protein
VTGGGGGGGGDVGVVVPRSFEQPNAAAISITNNDNVPRRVLIAPPL